MEENKSNNFKLENFTEAEKRIWTAIIEIVASRRQQEIFIPRKELITKSNYNINSEIDFDKDLKSVAYKTMSLNTPFTDDEGNHYNFSLFPTFSISKEGVKLQVYEWFELWRRNCYQDLG